LNFFVFFDRDLSHQRARSDQDLRNGSNYSGNILRKMNLYTIYSGTA
jgi:hypothetical protein